MACTLGTGEAWAWAWAPLSRSSLVISLVTLLLLLLLSPPSPFLVQVLFFGPPRSSSVLFSLFRARRRRKLPPPPAASDGAEPARPLGRRRAVAGAAQGVSICVSTAAVGDHHRGLRNGEGVERVREWRE